MVHDLLGPLGTPVSPHHLDPRHACTIWTPVFEASLEKAESVQAGVIPFLVLTD